MAGKGLQAFSDAQQAWSVMGDQNSFGEYLRSVDQNRMLQVIGSLEIYEEEFKPEHVVPGCAVLLNLLPDLPEERATMFEIPTTVIVGRVYYRLLRSPENARSY